MSIPSGVLPILPTIFDDRSRPDEAGMRRVLEYVIESGAGGVVFPGLASEYDTLAREERLHLSARVGEWVRGRVPYIVGASAASLEDASAYAQAGARAGAEVAMVLTPHALVGDDQRMADFYRHLHEASGLTLMLQNAPPPMGIGMALPKVAAIAREVPALRYVKEEAQPSGQRITQLGELAGPALDAVYGGAGARYLMDELLRGARGTMPACEITELHVQMWNHFQHGRERQARDLFERTLPLLSMQANFRWRLTKAVLKRRGLIESEHVRAPGPALDRHDLRELDALLERLRDLLPGLLAGAQR
jgi:dihydrodipicolinate synthase/N-acetylneuraminate lyase